MSRAGRSKKPAYRIVAADQRAARDGRFIELIGRYQPINPNPDQQLVVDAEKALAWLKRGATPSDTVRSLLRKKGVLKAFHDYQVEEHKKRKEAAAAAAKA
jgi:small subunit ribosomal protein S16